MASCRESDDSDLLDTPFLGVCAAVAECVLDISKRYCPMSFRESVFHDADGHALLCEPVCDI